MTRRPPTRATWCECGYLARYEHREPDGLCPHCNRAVIAFDLVPRGGAAVVRTAVKFANMRKPAHRDAIVSVVDRMRARVKRRKQ